MSVVGLLTKRNRFIGSVAIDAYLEENHKSSNKITEFPIEYGVNVNVHKTIQPNRLIIRGAVSDITPFVLGFQGKLPDFLNGTSQTRSVQAFNDLKKLITQNNLFDVQTGLVTYQNMQIESLEVDRNARTIGKLEFVLKLVEFIVVSTETTRNQADQYPPGDVRNKYSPENERGRAQAPRVDAAESAYVGSYLQRNGIVF